MEQYAFFSTKGITLDVLSRKIELPKCSLYMLGIRSGVTASISLGEVTELMFKVNFVPDY